ncbi:hypothetical protein PoB_002767800 [Plakobranchus ocellatus]|uniref:Uncharacterized protein n=1 Tax=Plakobranchus ocellatus TaxID=259542 RepID=A0AAV4A3D1_9GAST|nr:hypothetical protein PoB_002767800 [Plakobranchus ocellatus]
MCAAFQSSTVLSRRTDVTSDRVNGSDWILPSTASLSAISSPMTPICDGSHCTTVRTPSVFCKWSANNTASLTSFLPYPPKACTKARITTPGRKASFCCLLVTILKHSVTAFNSLTRLVHCTFQPTKAR